MIEARFLVATAIEAVAAVLILGIGVAIWRRRVDGPGGRAARLYAIWWFALGVDVIVNRSTWILGALGLDAPAVVAPLAFAAVAAVTAMLWGLVYYLVYLFTGSQRVFWPLTAFYALSFIGGAALVASLEPTGVTTTPWGGALAYAHEPSGATAVVFALFFLLPPILGAIAYGTLAFRVEGARRYRIAVVATSIFVWFASSLLGAARPDVTDAGAIAGMLIGLGAIGAIWTAYSPPAWLRRRLAIHDARDLHPVPALADGAVARARSLARRPERAARLAQRLRDLV